MDPLNSFLSVHNIAPVVFVATLILLTVGYFFRRSLLRSRLGRVIGYLGNFELNFDRPPTARTIKSVTGSGQRSAKGTVAKAKALSKRDIGGKHVNKEHPGMEAR